MQVDNRVILYMLAKKFDLKRDTTESRLRLQKVVYLLQAFGLKLGYGFSWYKYGPYSQNLVQDSYRVLCSEKNQYENATQSLKFSKNSLKRFEDFKKICKEILQNPAQLELIASVDFVRNTWSPESEMVQFTQVFKEFKRHLYDGQNITDQMIEKALQISKELRPN